MIPSAVVDASVAVKWVVTEPGSEPARSLSSADLSAPDLLLVECANILWKKARNRELTHREASQRLSLLTQAPVQLAPSDGLLDSAYQLAAELDHPVYDCLYLALALRKQMPLVTADRRLYLAVSRRGKPRIDIRLLDRM